MSISIRKADEQDFPAILSLIKEFSIFQKTPEKVSISLDQMLLEKNYFQSFVAETEDGKIVGFASFFSLIIPGRVKPSTWTICTYRALIENKALVKNYWIR